MLSVAAAVLVSGTVFSDVDGDGVFSAPDQPVAGATVVWETSVFTTTDADGHYQLDAPFTGIVWVRTPEGYSPAPSWRQIPIRNPQELPGIDLPLVPNDVPGPIRFVQSGDTHVGTTDLENTRLAIEQAADLDPRPHFYSITGDITAGTAETEFEDFEAARQGVTIPFVPVPGNHDWHDGGPLYRQFFGPPMYSFDQGGTHFIVLNFNAEEPEQLDFVRADLATVPDDRPVIVFTHAPLPDALAAALELEGVDYAFTGHEHANRIFEHGSLIEVNTETLAMGGIDFTPAGYRIVKVEDGVLSMTHHTVVRQRFATLTYPPQRSCVAPGRVPLVVAAELGATEATVTVRVDGGPVLPLERTGGWTYTGMTEELPPGIWHTVHVEASGGSRPAVSDDVEFCTYTGETTVAEIPDWPQLQGSSEHKGATEAVLEPPLVGVWGRSVGTHMRGGSPVLADGRLFVPLLDLTAAEAGGIMALDAHTGETLWGAKSGHSVHNAPAVEGHIVVFASADGIVHAHDVVSGEELWRYDLSTGVERHLNWLYSAPTIAEGRVYIGYQPRFVALDLETGAEQWSFQPSEAIWAASYAPAAVTGGVGISILGRGAGSIEAWDPIAYAPHWSMELPAWTRVHAAPIVDGATAYIANVETHLCAIDTATGSPAWTQTLYDDDEWAWWVLGSPALAGGRLFVPTPRGRIWAVDAASGEIDWSATSGGSNIHAVPYKTKAAGFLAAAVVTGDVVWAGGMDGYLRAWDAASGRERWRLDLGAAILSGPVPAPPYLFVASYDGTVRAFAADPAIATPPHPDDGCGCRVGGRGRGGGAALFVLLTSLLAWLSARPSRPSRRPGT